MQAFENDKAVSARERRIAGAVGELRALLASGAVDAQRTAEHLAGVLGRAAMEDAATTIRLSVELLRRVDALAEEGFAGGGRVSRAVVLRRAIELGLDALDAAVAEQSAESGIRAELAEIRARLAELERRGE